MEHIFALKDEAEAAGLNLSGIESVNIHDVIKTGHLGEQYIVNYVETLENLENEDIHPGCCKFMPVFDWTRRPDGSTVLTSTEAVDALRK